jgi:hypothetical protein
MPRDYLAEAHLIARTAAGLGNPLDLTCAEFDRHLLLCLKGYESKADAPTDSRDWARRYVERSIT